MTKKKFSLPNKVNEFIRKYQLSAFLVYAVFFIMIMIVYRFIFLNIGDDSVSNRNIDIMNVPFSELMSYAYTHGKSIFCRYWYTVMCYALLRIGGGIFWRPFIGFAYVVAAFALGKLFPIAGESHVKNAVISCFAILLFPLLTMCEAGWLSTSIVYVVPLAFLLVGAIGLKKSFLQQKIKWYGYPVYLLCLYLGTCHEQSSTLFFGLVVFLVGYKVFKAIRDRKQPSIGRKPIASNVYFTICCLRCTYQCYVAVTWPSNADRLNSEIKGWFVEYLSLNTYDKLYLGFQDTMHYIIATKPVTLTILSVMLCLVIFTMYKDTLYRVLGLIPVGIMCVFGMFSDFFETLYPNLDYAFSQNVGTRNFINIRYYMSTMISLFLILIICINIYLVFQNTFSSVFFAALFCGGLCTRYIMGFSASLYASLYRTAFFLFMTMIVIIFRLLSELRSRSRQKLYPVGIALVVIFGALSMLDLILYV